jgi:hypothetical protein
MVETTMSDEEFVRSVWRKVHVTKQRNHRPYWVHSTTTYLGNGPFGTESEMWSAAAAFTRERQEQVRQAEFDIDHVTKFRDAVGRCCHEHPYTSQTLDVEIPNLQSWQRILARLESIRADLKRGMKETA